MNTTAHVVFTSETKLYNIQVSLIEITKQLEQEGKLLAAQAVRVSLLRLAEAENHAKLGH